MNHGCVAADFYCSTTRFEPTLTVAGFKKYSVHGSSAITSLALLFQPLTYVAKPVNLFFKINRPDNDNIEISFENTYMVKSDGDQDRPNLITIN